MIPDDTSISVHRVDVKPQNDSTWKVYIHGYAGEHEIQSIGVFGSEQEALAAVESAIPDSRHLVRVWS